MFNEKVEGSIDIGCSSIKGVALKKGKIDKLDMEPLMHGAILSGALEDHLAVTDAIKAIASRLGLKGKNVAVSIPAQNFAIKFMEISKVADKEKLPLIENELEDIVPGYNAANFITDFITLEGGSPGREKVCVMAIQKEKINTLIEILTAAKLKPVRIIPDFIGLFNLLEGTKLDFISNTDRTSLMVVDIGSEATKVFVNKDGEIKMQRLAPIGGNDLNDVIQRLQNMDHDEAETYKYNLELKDDNPDEEKEEVFNEVGELIEELNSQIKRSIDYYKMQEGIMGIDEMIISGGSTLLKGYKDILEKKLGVVIHKFPTSRLIVKKMNNIAELEANMCRYDIAIGNIIEEVSK